VSPDLGETIAFGTIAVIILGSGLASSMVKRTFHSVMFLGVALVSVASLFILLGSPLIGVIQILVYVGGILTLFVFAVMFVAGDEKEEDAYVAPPRRSAWGILAALVVGTAALYVALMFIGPANGHVGAWFTQHGWFKGWPGGQANWVMIPALIAGVLVIVAAVVAGIVAWMGARHVLYSWSGQRILGVVVAVAILAVLLNIASATAAWTASPTDANQTKANDLDTIVTLLFGHQVVALEVLGVLLTAVMIGSLVIARPLTGPSDKERYAHTTRAEIAESQQASRPGAVHKLPASPVAATPAATPPSSEVME